MKKYGDPRNQYYDKTFAGQVRDDAHLRIVAELTRLHQMDPAEIAAEYPHPCPACGALMTPLKLRSETGRVFVVWPDACGREGE